MSLVNSKNFGLCLASLLAGVALLSVPAVAHRQEQSVRVVNPPSLPPAHGYSHVVIAPPGRLVSISGQVAIDSTGAVVGEGDFMVQCAQVFENLSRALSSVGLTFRDVVRTDHFVTDLAHLSDLRECRMRYLPADDPPASTLLKVAGLFRPELMLEVAIEAVLPERQ
jgi:enamine deaminase RidA (YjgF/YER057c/UK114 family)